MFGTRYGTTGKNNNFLLIRYLAATSVVLTHCFSILSGRFEDELLVSTLGRSIGHYAVDVFFVVSGFVVLQSLYRNENLIDFVTARVLRIFPALLCAVFATVFLLGPAVSEVPIREYFTSPETTRYLFGAISTTETDLSLAGVFASNPEAYKVNTPLWTLKYEIFAYASLAGLAMATGILGKRAFIFGIAASFIGIVLTRLHLGNEPYSSFVNLVHLTFCFYLGSMAFLFRRVIPLNLLGIILLAAVATQFHGTSLGPIIGTLFLAYSTFWLAFVPKVPQPGNGDYSYGIYIFAYPIQQTLFWLLEPQQPMALFILTMAIVVPFAALSWHIVEKPSLKARGRIVETCSLILEKITGTDSVVHQKSVGK